MNSYKNQYQLYFQEELPFFPFPLMASVYLELKKYHFAGGGWGGGVFLVLVGFRFGLVMVCFSFYLTNILLISSSLTLFEEMSFNYLDPENNSRFTCPSLTLPYRKIHSQICCSCHLFQENLKVELFIFSGT